MPGKIKLTKEQLHGMSDKQVNCYLSSLLHDSEMVGNLHGGEFFIAKTKQGVEYFVVNYCNNPTDIMPLAFEHKIRISPYMDIWCADFIATGQSYFDSSPLRAMACCLILVLQDKE